MSSENGAAAIRVEGLGKRYRIAATQKRHNTLRDHLSGAIRGAFRTAAAAARGRRAEEPDTIWALRDVDFEVKPGEALGIVGGNGAGKSTLLKVLSRVTSPTEGRAELRGRIGSLLEVGAGFHSELTGRENTFLNGAVLGMKRHEILAKFDDIVAFAGVERFIDMPVKYYSSGMYLRLAFSVAAHLEPDILVVDEVLAVGDHDFQRRCLSRMHDLSTDLGRTVVVVSHDMRAIQRLCDRCILLEGGRVHALGPTADVIAEYMARGSGHSAAGSWVDLTEVGRRGFGPTRLSGKARFVAARYGGGSAADGPLRTEGPVEFLLRVEAVEPVVAGTLGVTLSVPGGSPLLALELAALERELELDPGGNTVRFALDALHLRPGSYDVGLRLGDRHHRPMDRIDAAFRLDVADEASGAGPRVEVEGDGVVSGRYAVDLVSGPDPHPADEG